MKNSDTCYTCRSCDSLFHGEQCGCGWKRPSNKTMEIKSTDSKATGPIPAWKLMDKEQKVKIKNMIKDAPKSEHGASKSEISSYWIGQINKMNSGYAGLIKGRVNHEAVS